MSRDADFREANLRIKRWAKAACETGRIKGGADPYVTYNELRPPASRWCAWEKMKWTLDGTADGPKVETEACVAAAPSAGELLHKYSLWATDVNRQAYFRERQLRGQSMSQPPPDPPEWAEYRKAMAVTAAQAEERTAEWVKKAARGAMDFHGFNDPVKFELAWREAVKMGLVKG
jgi:hypothetical protein